MREKNNAIAVLLVVFNLIGCIVSVINCFYTKNVPISTIVIPVLYTILFFFCRNNKRNIGSPGLFTLNLMMFFRYQITFISYFFNDYISKMSFFQEHYEAAIAIMVFEMAVTFLSIELLYSKKTHIAFNNGNCHGKANLLLDYNGLNSPKAIILSILVLLFLIFLAYTNQSLIGNTDILYGISSNTITEDVSGPIGILWQSLLVVIYLFYIFKYYLSYVETGNKKYVFLTLIISIAYLVFIYICQKRISRWYLVVSFIASIFLFYKMYPKDIKGMLLTIGIPIGVILFTGSLYKTSSNLVGTGIKKQIEGILNPTNCDAYFAGIGNITSAIEMRNRMHGSFTNLIQDIINNMPYVNSKYDTSFASVDIFNLMVGRTDQIIPCIGQGIFYLSSYFAPIVSIISVVIIRRLDGLFSKSLNMKTFVYSFAAVFAGLLPCLNFTIFLSWIYIRIIPFTIIICFMEFLLSYKNPLEGELFSDFVPMIIPFSDTEDNDKIIIEVVLDQSKCNENID